MADGSDLASKPRRCSEDGLRLFTVAEFYRMAADGILGADERLELVDGLIYEMAPIEPRQAEAEEELAGALRASLAGRAHLRTQKPVRLDDWNEPLPDVAVVFPRQGGYADRHPIPSEIHLLAEVANSTLRGDKRHKIPSYARAGIPEVWLVDLERRLVTVYWEPSADGYLSSTEVGQDRNLTSLAFPDLSILASHFIRGA